MPWSDIAPANLAKSSTLQKRTSRRGFRLAKIVVSSLLIFLGGVLIGWYVYHKLQPAKLPAEPISKTLAPSRTRPANPSSVSSDNTKRDATRKQDLKSLAAALEVYRTQTGSYPIGSDISALKPLLFTSPPYLLSIPADPTSNDTQAVNYGYSSNEQSFSLSTRLENSSDNEAEGGIYSIQNQSQ